ncbi:MAG: TRAP transporter substrate-binding protein DctP [Rhodocyclaceae bacterium]
MKTVMPVIRSLIASTSLLLATGAFAADITWRVPTSVPEGSPFYNNFLKRFVDNARSLSDGRIELQPFGAGVIVPALEVYASVEKGVVEAGHSTPSYLVNRDPINAVFAGFPGGMGPEAYITWIYEGGGRQRLEALRAEEGFKTLIVGIGSTEIMAHANKPIRNADDLKGLKYRTSGAWAEVMRDYFGAVPTVVPPGEIYTLLQRKGVDAIEWATPSSNQPEGFHQAARYIVVPGVHQPTFLWEVVVKQETWNAVPDDLKAKLEMAAQLTTYQGLSHFLAEDMKAMAQYRAGRNEVITLEPDFIKQLANAGRDWIAKKAEEQNGKGNARLAETLADYNAFKAQWDAEADYLIRD